MGIFKRFAPSRQSGSGKPLASVIFGESVSGKSYTDKLLEGIEIENNDDLCEIPPWSKEEEMHKKTVKESDKIEGLEFHMYDDGSGGAELNGVDIGSIDLQTKDVKIGDDGWTPMPYETTDYVKDYFKREVESLALKMGAKIKGRKMKCSELKNGDEVVFKADSQYTGCKIFYDGTVLSVSKERKTVCVSYLEGYKSRTEHIPFSDMYAVYSKDGKDVQFGSIRGNSISLYEDCKNKEMER